MVCVHIMCFEDMGCLNKEHSIEINPYTKPIINRARKTSSGMTTKVKTEQDKMEANGIIKSVDQAAKKATSMVEIEKQNDPKRT